MFFSRKIVHFMTVARVGSLAAAADLIALTPSALSRSISELESRLGVKLMLRTHQGIYLTEDGKCLQEKLLPHFFEINKLNAFYSKKKLYRNTVKIASDGFMFPTLIERVSYLMSAYPKKDFSIEICDGISIYDALVKRSYDLYITVSKLDEIVSEEKFSQLTLNPDKLGLVVSKNILEKYKDIRTLINNEKLIQRHATYNHPSFRVIDMKARSDGYYFSFFGVPYLMDVCHMVTSGTGVSILPQSFYQLGHLDNSGIKFIEMPFAFPMFIQRYVYFREERKAELQTLAEEIKE